MGLLGLDGLLGGLGGLNGLGGGAMSMGGAPNYGYDGAGNARPVQTVRVRPGFGARVLTFENGTFRTDHGEISLTVEKDGFQLGCTFVTWEAWRELKKRLEPANAVSSATTPEPTSQSAICRHNVNVGAGEVCHLCS